MMPTDVFWCRESETLRHAPFSKWTRYRMQYSWCLQDVQVYVWKYDRFDVARDDVIVFGDVACVLYMLCAVNTFVALGGTISHAWRQLVYKIGSGITHFLKLGSYIIWFFIFYHGGSMLTRWNHDISVPFMLFWSSMLQAGTTVKMFLRLLQCGAAYS